MFPFGLAVGFVAGAASAAMFAPQVAEQARPVAKAALKAALAVMHEVQVRGAEAVEAAEDVYAEAKAEVDEDIARATTASCEPAAQSDTATSSVISQPPSEAA